MKILALSDEVVPVVYSPSLPDNFDGVDLVVGCGDLPASYLEYVVSMLNVPLVYVPGNHDPDIHDIPGGVNIDGRIHTAAGIRVAGLGGSRRYKDKGRHQYTEAQMRVRVYTMLLPLLLDRTLRSRPLALFVTHSPPSGVHDGLDVAHQGFQAFHRILDLARPRMMLHGHSHVNQNLDVTQSTIGASVVMNVYPYRIIDLDERKDIGIAGMMEPV
jgi:Icc-related predicted phosphoesterase